MPEERSEVVSGDAINDRVVAGAAQHGSGVELRGLTLRSKLSVPSYSIMLNADSSCETEGGGAGLW